MSMHALYTLWRTAAETELSWLELEAERLERDADTAAALAVQAEADAIASEFGMTAAEYRMRYWDSEEFDSVVGADPAVAEYRAECDRLTALAMAADRRAVAIAHMLRPLADLVPPF